MGTCRLRVVVLASGNGSNLQAIIENTKNRILHAKVVAVISDNPSAYALERAQSNGIPTDVLDPGDFPGRREFDRELQISIDDFKPDLVVLAGFMRILTAQLVNHYDGRLMNIHPSLLPKHKGLNTHERALQAKDQYHGATVHFVIPELDSGPIIIQKSIEVLPTDTVDSLKQRVLQIEYEIYPLAIKWFANGELTIENGKVLRKQKR